MASKMTSKLLSGLYILYSKVAQLLLLPILRHEYNFKSLPEINERALEYAFVFESLYKICPEDVLDVGPGKSSLPHLMTNCGFRVTAIDQKKNYWQARFVNRHYWVVNDDITRPRLGRKFDAITCVSTLEHIRDHEAALKCMFELLNTRGYIILTIPYNETKYIENVYKMPGVGYGQDFPYIGQVFSKNEIDGWLRSNKGHLIRQEYYEVFSGDFWAFGKRKYPPKKVTAKAKHQLTCLLIQKQ